MTFDPLPTSLQETLTMSTSRTPLSRYLTPQALGWMSGFMLYFASGSAHAAGADFGAVRDFLQLFLNFMTGSFGKAVVVISIIAAFATWVFAPKDGIFGPILRVVVSGIAILNASVWVSQLGDSAGIKLT
jgi:type IV secretory pathway VirB2 component (pilin)